MFKFLVYPPVVFVIILLFCFLISALLRKVAFKSKKISAGSKESYACGEDNYNHMAQPDYSSFFPVAFFFTLAHVATLMIATIPFETIKSFAIAIIYILSAAVGLSIILKR
jgi:NADH-quinone oxidoreductase subunit A